MEIATIWTCSVFLEESYPIRPSDIRDRFWSFVEETWRGVKNANRAIVGKD